MILFIARPPALKNMALLYSITTRARRPTAKNLLRTRESSYGCAFLFIGKLHKSLHSIKKSNFKEITLVISNPCGNSFLTKQSKSIEKKNVSFEKQPLAAVWHFFYKEKRVDI